MYDIRALVEGYAALLAAERITSEGVARLRDNCDKLARCISEYEVGRATVLDFIEINTQFHNFIHALSGNRAINRVVALLWNLPKAYTRFYWERRERQRISLDFHMRIVDALANRRGTQAQNIMREHIMEAKDFLTQWLEIDSSGG
jgi:DNA-binding GntR family transcriptional regulator